MRTHFEIFWKALNILPKLLSKLFIKNGRLDLSCFNDGGWWWCVCSTDLISRHQPWSTVGWSYYKVTMPLCYYHCIWWNKKHKFILCHIIFCGAVFTFFNLHNLKFADLCNGSFHNHCIPSTFHFFPLKHIILADFLTAVFIMIVPLFCTIILYHHFDCLSEVFSKF